MAVQIETKRDNPFNGRCIHGVPGATIVRGKLTNSKCPRCQQTLAEATR